jgi:hypothetical protein
MTKHTDWLTSKITWIATCTSIYAVSLLANQWCIRLLGLSDSDSWMLLSGGVQLVLTLIFVEVGSIGIGLGTIVFYWLSDTPPSALFILITATLQAVAPMLARHLAIDLGGMKSNLAGLRAKQLLYLCWLFAAVSAALTQVWLTWYDPSHDFLQSTLIMASSYWLGTACVLSLMSLSAKKIYAWVQHH